MSTTSFDDTIEYTQEYLQEVQERRIQIVADQERSAAALAEALHNLEQVQCALDSTLQIYQASTIWPDKIQILIAKQEAEVEAKKTAYSTAKSDDAVALGEIQRINSTFEFIQSYLATHPEGVTIDTPSNTSSEDLKESHAGTTYHGTLSGNVQQNESCSCCILL